jgi:folylpolyglutamate synthase/dihydropteroate synthase
METGMGGRLDSPTSSPRSDVITYIGIGSHAVPREYPGAIALRKPVLSRKGFVVVGETQDTTAYVFKKDGAEADAPVSLRPADKVFRRVSPSCQPLLG